MRMDPSEEWFESVWQEGRRIPHVSKFTRKDFVVSVEVVKARWFSWTSEEKGKFASAFSQRLEMDDNDQRVLDFLMDNGEQAVWRAIALAVTRHRNRSRAISFLSARIAEGMRPIANFYQALGMLSAAECAPILQEALSRHQQEIEAHSSISAWQDRFIYLDYLSCCATLFLITQQEGYKDNLEKMLQHSDRIVRQLAHTVATTSGLTRT
jgi:hypothetical protein